VDLLGTLAPLRRGQGDPANRVDLDGTFWRACATPSGDGTLALRVRGATVEATAWGPGATWLLESVPALLGGAAEQPALDLSRQPLLAEVARRSPGIRLCATGLVMDELVPTILEQRVTGTQAHRAWRQLLRRYGRRAPGPHPDLWVPPSAGALLDVPTWAWHRFDVDHSRSRTVRAAATVARRLEECVAMPLADAVARLRHVPGVGEWTAAETAQRAFGHPDAISVGDFHLADVIVHFFTGRARGTDEEMVELLEPWRGQRQRVVRLILRSGVGKPKFGPRYAPLDMRAM